MKHEVHIIGNSAAASACFAARARAYARLKNCFRDFCVPCRHVVGIWYKSLFQGSPHEAVGWKQRVGEQPAMAPSRVLLVMILNFDFPYIYSPGLDNFRESRPCMGRWDMYTLYSLYYTAERVMPPGCRCYSEWAD